VRKLSSSSTAGGGGTVIPVDSDSSSSSSGSEGTAAGAGGGAGGKVGEETSLSSNSIIEQNNGRDFALIIVGIAVGLLLLGGGAFYFIRYKCQTTNKQATAVHACSAHPHKEEAQPLIFIVLGLFCLFVSAGGPSRGAIAKMQATQAYAATEMTTNPVSAFED
jgi:hypothetical protein